MSDSIRFYRLRLVDVCAARVAMSNAAEVRAWCGGRDWSRPPMRAVTGIEFDRGGATYHAQYGDYIVRVNEEFFVYSAPIFEGLYVEDIDASR